MKQTFRALALLLALLLTGAAALSEAASQPVEPNVASVELALGGEVRANGEEVIPEYQPMSYEMSVDEAVGSFDCYLGDQLYICHTGELIASTVSSNPDVATVWRDLPNISLIGFQETGKAKITLTLQSGRTQTLSVTVLDPTAPTAIGVDEQRFDLRAGCDMFVQPHVILEPEWAMAEFKYKSSSRRVAKVDADGLVTALKPGKAVITVTAGRGLKAQFTVNVTANRAEALAPVPGKADAQALGDGWTLWPRSAEPTAKGGIVLEAYVLNGTDQRLTGIEGLELGLTSRLETGEEVTLARHAFPKVKVTCPKKGVKAVKLTFPAESLTMPSPDLTGGVSAALYGAPKAQAGKAGAGYVASPYLAGGAEPGPENPSVYRALLVSESDFYWKSSEGGHWEHDRRNLGDVKIMADMLSNSVLAPNGSRYSVTTRDDTSKQQLIDLIAETFADADDNDVSLFFIATHGVNDIEFPEEEQGALGMASLTEDNPELLLASELRDCLLKVPGKVIVLLQSCGSGAVIYQANGEADPDAAAKGCAAFDAAVVKAFRDADPGILGPADVESNTGDLRRANKFYVLTASSYHEPSYGSENPQYEMNNYFTAWLWQGVGRSGSMPADKRYAGNGDGRVDLHELYRFIEGMSRTMEVSLNGAIHHQHAEVYPADTRYLMFK